MVAAGAAGPAISCTTGGINLTTDACAAQCHKQKHDGVDKLVLVDGLLLFAQQSRLNLVVDGARYSLLHSRRLSFCDKRCRAACEGVLVMRQAQLA
jgi:hypothetical protein